MTKYYIAYWNYRDYTKDHKSLVAQTYLALPFLNGSEIEKNARHFYTVGVFVERLWDLVWLTFFKHLTNASVNDVARWAFSKDMAKYILLQINSNHTFEKTWSKYICNIRFVTLQTERGVKKNRFEMKCWYTYKRY